jgi:hypothetical protein
MTFKPLMLLRLLSLSALVLAAPAWAQRGEALTLDQAVEQVQHETGGKVLSADQRQYGRRMEYRIKVLTPSGHIRTMAVPSEPGKGVAPAQSTKNPAASGRGNKEKH